MASDSQNGKGDDSDMDDAVDGNLAFNGHRPEDAESPSPSYLENLPAELRVLLLLSMPDLPTLRSLVSASPVLHAQYRYDRDEILRACLSRELDGFFIDAYVTAASWDLGLSLRSDEIIIDCLNTYELWLSGSTPFLDIKSIDPARIHWMVAFHISVARPLARLYVNWALANLNEAILSSRNSQRAIPMEANELLEEGIAAQGDYDSKLSRSEEMRVLRAIYRYETFHNLFGRRQGRRQGGFLGDQAHEAFFCRFDPWEAEAIGCIDTFVVFRQKNGVFNPHGSYDIEREYDDLMDGTVARGLKVATRLLMIDDHEKLVSEMQKYLIQFHWGDYPMREVLGCSAQYERRELSDSFPNTRDEAEQRRDPIHFVGDTVPPDGPTFAWVSLWGRKYSNIYGDYVPRSLRRWGYVMWDKRRWINMGAGEDLIVGQWETSPQLVQDIEVQYNWRPGVNQE
ncbi:hypothetical protein GQX73_g4903 [Xylaria multiplex]|uniref:Uncharacterized protein n=1 Tax=Xylaria multiplex TaxID=323545 RepID=A0A7C8IP68_9PEZI|nr:hypothetical protein GQX73_g4903 [Xylaria multiplex]